MAIILRPISFHWSSTAPDGPSAGFGGSLGFWASVWATAGITARNAARQTPARHTKRFITLPLFPLCREPSRSVWGPLRGKLQGVPNQWMLRRMALMDVSLYATAL